ncbi:MAG TPA: lysylphosphatidylglycerol synthase transmembrane domain-containing protein [Candidatus Aminicenantes bacterium]|nr:lysylphosphatidylglycerol synthase transmembrane domain-containing protein [Candidatus Aminicenantes bacterium]
MRFRWTPQPGVEGPPPTRGAKVRTLVIRIVGYAGFGLFVYLVVRTGPEEILRAIGRLSLGEIAALMALRFLYWLVRAVNWRALLAASGERPPFGHILGARIAGYAVSYLTPAGNIGGETVRIFCLDRVGRNKALATVVVDKTIEFLAGLSTVALAVVFLITGFALPERQKIGLFAAIAGLLLVLAFLILKQRQGLFAWALDTLKKIKIRIPFFENRRDKILETDAHIADFYRKNPRLFLALFASYFAQAWLWALEIYLTFRFLGGSTPAFVKCFLIVTLGSFYSFLPVPGSMGVYELTYVSLFALLRIEMSAGMAVILIRRVVGLVWAGIGIVPLVRKRSARPANGPGPPPAPGLAAGS